MISDDLKYKSNAELIDIWERAGYVYEISVEYTLLASGKSLNVFVAGSRPCMLFSRQVSYNGVGINAFIYRNPTYTGGTPLTWGNEGYENPNDIIAHAGLSTIISDPTIAVEPDDYGTLTRSPRYVFGNESVQGRGAPIQLIESPQLVLPGQEILLILENRDINNAQDLSSHFRWAEPPSIPGLVIQNGVYKAYNGATL